MSGFSETAERLIRILSLKRLIKCTLLKKKKAWFQKTPHPHSITLEAELSWTNNDKL